MTPRIYSRRKGAEPAPPGAIYVGRPTIYGNRFMVGVHGDQGDCVRLHRNWIMAPERAAFRARVRLDLAGRDLVCWCKDTPDDPTPCHAETLLEIANPECVCRATGREDAPNPDCPALEHR